MALDLSKDFKTDETKEEEGVWEELGDGCEILVARTGNKKYDRELERRLKPYRNQMRRGTLKNDKLQEVLIQVMAKHILLGWKGLKEDGQDVPYNKENALRILQEYKDFRELVMEIAQSMDVFRVEDEEEGQENLESTSSGM